MPEARTLDEFEMAETLDKKGVWMHVAGEFGNYVWTLCPHCGCRSALRIGGDLHPRWEIVQQEPLTLEPSIVHNAEWCGWHGYLRNGEFVKV